MCIVCRGSRRFRSILLTAFFPCVNDLLSICTVNFVSKMFSSSSIVQLYENVMYNDMGRYNISDDAIRISIESMAHVYSSDTLSLSSLRSVVADYNDVAHRCAYLHKFAAFHTVMVQDLLCVALKEHFDFFSRWRLHSESNFNICSLGGGPGTDIIAVVSALHSVFGFFPVSATVVDYMFNWSYSFDSILRELGSDLFGDTGRYMCFEMNSRYVAANLLKPLTPNVLDVLSRASMVTMIKFVSATACQDTVFMLKNIFAAMKPGALVLYIDNNGGGSFHNLFMDAAIYNNFISIYGPLKRINYTNDETNKKRFGYTSCRRTIVTLHILQKPTYKGLHVPNPQRNDIFDSPPTPMLFNPIPLLQESSAAPLYNNSEFSTDENIDWENFRSSAEEELQRSHIERREVTAGSATPVGNHQNKKKRIKHIVKAFSHHLGVKFNNIKSRARKVLIKNKNKKNHPIFSL